MKWLNLLAAAAATGMTGCVERQVVYVPSYERPPTTVNQPGTTYNYPEQSAYAPPPEQAVTDSNVPTQTASNEPVAVAGQAPPPPQPEVITVAPGPGYYWVPGYWGWRGGTWIWIGGAWVARPWHGAVWVGGHWVPHRHGYVWVGGRWR